MLARGGTVATQKKAIQLGLIPDPNAPVEPPAIPQGVKPSASATPEAPIASMTPSPMPVVPQVLQTATATPLTNTTPFATATPTAGASGSVTATPPPQTEAQKNLLIKKQAEAVKGSQFLNKYQSPDKKITPPVPQAAQAAMTAASPYIPAKVSTSIPYQQDKAAISTVASRPEMAGLSALTKAVAAHESRGVNEATSPTDVKGIMQVTGGTGKGINPRFNRRDPVQQAMAGAIHLSNLNDKYPNSPMLALTAYNAGTVVVNEAVRLARTSNWDVVKNYMEEAGNSDRVQNAWIRDFMNSGIKGMTESKARNLAKGKVKEASTYAEKVIVNFPSFAFNADDNRVLNLLKQQGVFQS